jgi:hypothetical protein
MIKKLKIEVKDMKAKGPATSDEEVKKLKVSLKQKDKKISENQKDLKLFVDKLAALENQGKGKEKENVTNTKYKNIIAELGEKKKALKQTQDDLEKANKRTRKCP